jgi:hypothetical protein
MRKVNIQAKIRVMVPVELTVDMLIRADDGANFTKLLRRFSQGLKHTPGGDLEDITVESRNMDEDGLDEAIAEALDDGSGFELLFSKVTDSR